MKMRYSAKASLKTQRKVTKKVSIDKYDCSMKPFQKKHQYSCRFDNSHAIPIQNRKAVFTTVVKTAFLFLLDCSSVTLFVRVVYPVGHVIHSRLHDEVGALANLPAWAITLCVRDGIFRFSHRSR